MENIRNNLGFGLYPTQQLLTLDPYFHSARMIVDESQSGYGEVHYHFIDNSIPHALKKVIAWVIGIFTFFIPMIINAVNIRRQNRYVHSIRNLSDRNLEFWDVSRAMLFHQKKEITLDSGVDIRLHTKFHRVASISFDYHDIYVDYMYGAVKSHFDKDIEEKRLMVEEYLKEHCLREYEEVVLNTELEVNYETNTITLKCALKDGKEISSVIKTDFFDEEKIETAKDQLRAKLENAYFKEKSKQFVTQVKSGRTFPDTVSDQEYCFTVSKEDTATERLFSFQRTHRDTQLTEDIGTIIENLHTGNISQSANSNELKDALYHFTAKYKMQLLVAVLIRAQEMIEEADHFTGAMIEPCTFAFEDYEVSYQPNIHSNGNIESLTFSFNNETIILSNDGNIAESSIDTDYQQVLNLVKKFDEVILEKDKNSTSIYNAITNFNELASEFENEEVFIDLETFDRNFLGKSVTITKLSEEDEEEAKIQCSVDGNVIFEINDKKLLSGESKDALDTLKAISSFILEENRAKEEVATLFASCIDLHEEGANNLDIRSYIQGIDNSLDAFSLQYVEGDDGENELVISIHDKEIVVKDGKVGKWQSVYAAKILSDVISLAESVSSARDNVEENPELLQTLETVALMYSNREVPSLIMEDFILDAHKIEDEVVYTIKTIDSEENDRTLRYSFTLSKDRKIAFTEFYCENNRYSFDRAMGQVSNKMKKFVLDDFSDCYLYLSDREQVTFSVLNEVKNPTVASFTIEEAKQESRLKIMYKENDLSQEVTYYAKKSRGGIFTIEDEEEKVLPENLWADIVRTIKEMRLSCSLLYSSNIISTKNIREAVNMYYHVLAKKLSFSEVRISGNRGGDEGGLSREFFSCFADATLKYLLPKDQDELKGNYQLSKYCEFQEEDDDFQASLEQYFNLGRMCQIAYMQNDQMPVGRIFTPLFAKIVRTFTEKELQGECGPKDFIAAKRVIAQARIDEINRSGYIESEEQELLAKEFALDVYDYFEGKKTTEQILQNPSILQIIKEDWMVEEEELGDQILDFIEKDDIEDLQALQAKIDDKDNNEVFVQYLDYRLEAEVGKFLHPAIATTRGMISRKPDPNEQYFYTYITLDKLKRSHFLESLQGKLDRNEVANAITYTGLSINISRKVSWIKEYIRNCTEKELRDFLQFTTGSNTWLGGGEISIHGLAAKNDGYDDMPVAHTCFSRLDIRNNWMTSKQRGGYIRRGLFFGRLEAAYKKDYIDLIRQVTDVAKDGYTQG